MIIRVIAVHVPLSLFGPYLYLVMSAVRWAVRDVWGW
jgi:hypothetical protein